MYTVSPHATRKHCDPFYRFSVLLSFFSECRNIRSKRHSLHALLSVTSLQKFPVLLYHTKPPENREKKKTTFPGFIFILHTLSYWEGIQTRALVGFVSDNNCTFWITLAACLLFGQESAVFERRKKKNFSTKKSYLFPMINTRGNSGFALRILSTHPLTYFVCGRHNWLMTSCIEVACQQSWCKSRNAAAWDPCGFC